MSALICGSVAYDNIMVFPDHFRNHILPDKVHVLSVSFLVPEMRKELGGCAGNIAYNLKLLGGDPLPMATVGNDFDRYGRWMDKWAINRRHIVPVNQTFTAQAYIITDLDDNQITAFHPGAMSYAHLNDVTDAEGVTVGIVAPDGREGMVSHATQFADAGIPFIFDPGQGLPMFDGADLRHFIDQASWITVNDYEWEMMHERTGYTIEEAAKKVKALIVTRGAKGSFIYTSSGTIEVPVAKLESELKDPTGCGDAYRAGILFGLMNDLDWATTGRIASLMGAIKIECNGTQNHRFDRAGFEARFQASFGRSL